MFYSFKIDPLLMDQHKQSKWFKVNFMKLQRTTN